MSRAEERFVTRVLVLVIAGLLTAVAARYMHRFLDKVESENFGYEPNPAGVREFLGELDAPFFADAAPEAMRESKKVDTFLYRAMNQAHRARYGRDFVVGKQGIGDCVAWGAAHAVYCSESVSFQIGNVSEPPVLPATEAIYGGSRVEARGKDGGGSSPVGGWSDGSYGGAAAKWLRDWGVVYRKHFPEFGYDLTSYSAERAKNWGAYGAGGAGDKGRLDAEAKKHPARHVVAVRTWDELVAAITAGFPVTIASSQGFGNRTDDSGVLPASGTWMHQMCVIGVRFADQAPDGVRKIDAALILNSWGTNWLAYGGKYPQDQPDGSFWASRQAMEGILRQNDSYAIGDIKTGFKWRDIHHGNWLAK